MNDTSNNPVTRAGVIGLGAMGLQMARHMVRKGFDVAGFDVDIDAMRRAVGHGVKKYSSVGALLTSWGSQGSGDGPFGLGKSGRVQHHSVKRIPGRAPVAKKIESVSLDPLNRGLDAVPIHLKVFFRYLESRPGGVDSCYAAAGLGQMQSETALVGADVERLAVGIAGRGGVVQTLVKKGSGLLPGIGVVVKGQPIEMEDGP